MAVVTVTMSGFWDEPARTFGRLCRAYRDGPIGQNAEKRPVPPNCHGGRSRDLGMACFGACFRRPFGITGSAAAERFSAGKACAGSIGEPGSGVSSLVAGPRRLSRRGHTKSSARPGGPTIGSPLTSTRVVIESVKGGLDGLSPAVHLGWIFSCQRHHWPCQW
jgi:hypothetical protein